MFSWIEWKRVEHKAKFIKKFGKEAYKSALNKFFIKVGVLVIFLFSTYAAMSYLSYWGYIVMSPKSFFWVYTDIHLTISFICLIFWFHFLLPLIIFGGDDGIKDDKDNKDNKDNKNNQKNEDNEEDEGNNENNNNKK